MLLSIIIPVFNEEKTVKVLIDLVLKVDLPKNITKEIIVINDGSSDNTSLVLKAFKKKELRVLTQSKNKGKGAAVREGIKKASGEIIIIQDADLEYNPNDYSKLLQPILEKKTEVVYGSRLLDLEFILSGKNKTPLPHHYIANKFLTFLTNFLYGSNLTDMETCYKVFKKSVIKKINLESNGFEIEPEITAKILLTGHKIVEIPIKVKPRTKAEGKKINFNDGIIAISTLLKYRFS